MVPPKSYADMVRGARKSPPPILASPVSKTAATPPPLAPLPVLSPSSSVSSVTLAKSESQPEPQHQNQNQQQRTHSRVTGTIRSYAAAVKGTHSRPLSLPPSPPPPPPSSPRPLAKMEAISVVASSLPSSLPSPSTASQSASPSLSPEIKPEPKPETEPEPETEPDAAGLLLWESGRGHDVIISCGEAKWFVHRHVLVRMSKFMEEFLPPPREDGQPVVWRLNPTKWHAPMLSNILRFMYIEEYDNCDYDYENPLNTESININVNHFIAGSSVHCRQMMDHALSRLEDAREDIREEADFLRHAKLDNFQLGILRAHRCMWDQSDQWRLISLRIVMGKLMAVAFPLILQSPHWANRYRQLWGTMYLHVVADHIWLHTADFCPHVPAITKGFQHMQIRWVKYRPNGWKLEDDFMFPKGKAPDPSPPSPPSTPHRTAKKKPKAIPTLRPDGTIDTSQAAPRGGPRGRGRGGPSNGLVQPTAKGHNGQGKEKDKGKDKSAEEAVAGTTDNAGPTSAADTTNDAGPSPIAGPPSSTGPYPTTVRNPAAGATMLDRPMPVGFAPYAGANVTASPFYQPPAPAWAWPQTLQLYRPSPPPPHPPFAPGFPPSPSFSGYPSSSSSNRPSSSGQLSATAEPFMPNVRLNATEPSLGSSPHSVTRLPSPVLDSPTRLRMAELYLSHEPGESSTDAGKGKDSA
ncbi:hypothetical protein VP1G_04905 [Cytospora mali]|uniref:BTB domain-containing protein n=1 Tax=Cytospora mali TaxID=578113 RepID=A0A194V0Y4_CYTMA|nr:hypothetical protein VP1G_04905 [Valsa mali var. pyri (nom. inval.)]